MGVQERLPETFVRVRGNWSCSTTDSIGLGAVAGSA